MGFIKHIPGSRPLPEVAKSPEALGVGVVGLHEGRTLLLALNRCAHAYPVAGCDLDAQKVAASKSELPDLMYTGDYEEMLGRPDVKIVAIYTPDSMHVEHITRAFEAGKDVICTKPLVNSLGDAQRVLETGRETGRRLMVGQSSRFFEPFVRQRRAFERGEMGEVELIDAHYIHRMDWYYEKSPWAAKETDWVFLGMSHPLDLLRWYLGRIETVQAFGAKSSMGGRLDVAGSDMYIVNVVSSDGVMGRAMGHYGAHELPTARNCIEMMLYGSEGTSLAQYHDMKYVYTGSDGANERRSDEGEEGCGFDAGVMGEVTEDCLYAGRHYYFNSEVHGMHYGEFANYAEHFARAILSGEPNSPDLEEGIETVCLMEAVRRSAQSSGALVEVAPLLCEVGVS